MMTVPLFPDHGEQVRTIWVGCGSQGIGRKKVSIRPQMITEIHAVSEIPAMIRARAGALYTATDPNTVFHDVK